MTTTKTRTGNGPRLGRHGVVRLAGWCCLLVLVCAPAAAAEKKEKKKKPTAAAMAAAPAAMLAGTVFTGTGFALRGAELIVTPADAPPGKNRWRAVSDARGEFFLRLPPGPGKYNVSVQAPGLKPQEKQVSFTADERLDQNFVLEPATGNGK